MTSQNHKTCNYLRCETFKGKEHFDRSLCFRNKNMSTSTSTWAPPEYNSEGRLSPGTLSALSGNKTTFRTELPACLPAFVLGLSFWLIRRPNLPGWPILCIRNSIQYNIWFLRHLIRAFFYNWNMSTFEISLGGKLITKDSKTGNGFCGMHITFGDITLTFLP